MQRLAILKKESVEYEFGHDRARILSQQAQVVLAFWYSKRYTPVRNPCNVELQGIK